MLDLSQHERVVASLGGPSGWRTVRHEATVTSTNDVAAATLRGGVAPGVVVVADHQTAGRGRTGRPWDDGGADGVPRSLTVSCTVAVPASNATLSPLAVGLAAVDALRRAGVSPVLKWPNDVLVPGAVAGAGAGAGGSDGRGAAKIAGVLVERHEVAAGPALVVGVGIDTDWRDVDRDLDAVAWTSVGEVTGGDVDRGDLLADLLRGLTVWLDAVATDPTGLLDAYREACATIGADVRVTFPGGDALVGRALDLDRDGRLVVDGGSAGRVAVTAGDVTHVRPA